VSTNVRQLGLGFSLYVTDQGLPEFTLQGWGLALGDWHSWMYPNYSNNANVRLCPSTRNDANRSYSHGTANTPYLMKDYGSLFAGGPFAPFRPIYSSYGLNYWVRITATGPDMQPLFFRRETSIQYPSRTPIFADSITFTAAPVVDSPPTRDLYYDDVGGKAEDISNFQIARHGSRSPVQSSSPVAPGAAVGSWVNNMVCFDGHVERAKLDNLWQYYWHKNWEPPVVRPQ